MKANKDIQFLKSEEVQVFLRENENMDVHDISLHPPAWAQGFEKLLADQLISRQKARTKLPELYGRQGILFPPPLSLEQSSSFLTAEYKTRVISGASLVDFTGGFGVDIMVMSPFFIQTTYVEQNEWLCSLFEQNAKTMGLNARVIQGRAEEVLNNLKGNDHTLYLDPARRDGKNDRVFRFEDCSPDITQLLPQLFSLGKQILVKASPMIDLRAAIQSLDKVTEVHVVSVKNEVKEVLFLMTRKTGTIGEPIIHCVDFPDGQNSISFSFLLSMEGQAETPFASHLGKMLFIPNASVMKAGAFKSVAQKFPIQKISANTHLYTADEPLDHFPGRQFEILGEPLSKKDIPRYFADHKAHVISRNYPLGANEIKEKYKLTESGDQYLIGFRDAQQQPVLVAARKI